MSDSAVDENVADKFLGKPWMERLEGIADLIASELPGGAFIEALLKLFWPGEQQPSVWSQIQDQVEALIEQDLLEFEFGDLNGYLADIQDGMAEYKWATDPSFASHDATQIAAGFNAWQHAARRAINSILGHTKTRKHLIPYAVAISHLDMAAHRELMKNWQSFYPQLDANLLSMIVSARLEFYNDNLAMLYEEWETWRFAQIKCSYGAAANPNAATISFSDARTNVSFEWTTDPEGYPSNYFEGLANAATTAAQTAAMIRQASELASAAYLLRYEPGQEKTNVEPVVPRLGTIAVGPIGNATLGTTPDTDLTMTDVDQQGKAISGTIRAYNSIDFLQIQYDGHTGHGVGDPNGGTEYALTPPQGAHLSGFSTRWANGIMCEANCFYSDGTNRDYGNRDGWQGPAIDTSCGPGYYLYGMEYARGTGPSNRQGIKLVTFIYKHKALVDLT